MLAYVHKNIQNHKYIVIVLLTLLSLLTISNIAFLIVLFILLDSAKKLIELKYGFKFIPLRFLAIGIIIISYLHTYSAGIILIVASFFSRIFVGSLDQKDILGALIMGTVSILATILNTMPFVAIATILFVLGYIFEFIISISFFGMYKYESLPSKIIDSIAAFMFFNLFSLFI